MSHSDVRSSFVRNSLCGVVCAILILSQGRSTAVAQTTAPPPPPPSQIASPSSPLLGALAASFRLLMMEHAGRIMFQEKTRRELGGPFWDDYMRSVKIPGTTTTYM